MAICNVCGKDIPDSAKFCRHCGSPVVAAAEGMAEWPAEPDPEEGTVFVKEEIKYEEPVIEPQAYQPPQHEVQQYQQEIPPQAPAYNNVAAPEWDHSIDYDRADVSENKAASVVVYMLGPLGLIIGLLKKGESPFLDFHLKQGFRFAALDGIILSLAIFFSWMIPMGINDKINKGLSSLDLPSEFLGAGYGGVSIPHQIPEFIYAVLGICMLILLILKFASAVSAGSGKAKEPPILRSIGLLK